MIRLKEAIAYGFLTKGISEDEIIYLIKNALWAGKSRENQNVLFYNLLNGKYKKINPEYIEVIYNITGFDIYNLLGIVKKQ